MTFQGIYIKGDLMWRMGYDKENLETQENLNSLARLYILFLGDQYLFNITLTCDWGERAGNWNNFIPFRGEDWEEIVTDANQGGWDQERC